ncbi:tyrosine-type recombinase/integrase [Spirilliplanes yamanashiensis]|uniref:Tyr recombinase domain-containing protein n=1 Tax=Spirilliplanes yamanashiensis TaxID=42233 RepID=A0A8J3Y8N0_9ACTN|nr:tyrosine-type recombinase/integrase [Spirilliplanes yamanashiensis]MDP9816800.1 integrase [Spirilliplanes yamanashiensis]GIJ03545.1 hypothetical protein Sya03_28970 [Spirilliplanes yamanashiensis]
MAVDDWWYLAKRSADGARVPSERHGRGKRWRVRWIDNHGHARERLFDRKADDDRFDANIHADLSRGQYVDDRAGRITVAELAELWRNAQLHIDSTAIRVEHAVRLHVVPVLGRHRIKDVRPSHIQGWVRDRSGVLAPTTLRVVYAYLGGMFALAVRDRMISASPCDDRVRLPSIVRGSRFIPAAEQVHGLAATLPDRLAATVYLAAGCGLRLEEILGLEVDDIDFDARELHVRRQLKVLKGRQPFLGPVKTRTSVRTVELSDVAAESLREHLDGGIGTVEVDDDTDPRRPIRRDAALLFRE